MHGSVKGIMIVCASHSSGLFKTDNMSVYHKLEEATRSTKYEVNIAAFQKKKNGCATFLALVL